MKQFNLAVITAVITAKLNLALITAKRNFIDRNKNTFAFVCHKITIVYE